MYIPQIMPKQIQSLRPSKRKVVKTVYTTEKFAHRAAKEMPKEIRGVAQAVSDVCKNIRQQLTKQ